MKHFLIEQSLLDRTENQKSEMPFNRDVDLKLSSPFEMTKFECDWYFTLIQFIRSELVCGNYDFGFSKPTTKMHRAQCTVHLHTNISNTHAGERNV